VRTGLYTSFITITNFDDGNEVEKTAKLMIVYECFSNAVGIPTED